MEVIKSFKPCKKYINQQIATGTIMLVAGILALLVGKVYFIGLAILILVMALIQKDRDMVKMFAENMEIKFSPLASTKFLKYADISNIETVSEKKIFLHYSVEANTKKLRVPVHLFEKEDLTTFLDFIKERK